MSPKWGFGIAMLRRAYCNSASACRAIVHPKYKFYSASELWKACFRQACVAQAVLAPGALFHANTFTFPPCAPKCQQFTYGVVREGVIAEKFLLISEKFPQTFRRISAPFPGAINCISLQISAKFPQNFRKKPFANDPVSDLLKMLVAQSENIRDGKWIPKQ